MNRPRMVRAALAIGVAFAVAAYGPAPANADDAAPSDVGAPPPSTDPSAPPPPPTPPPGAASGLFTVEPEMPYPGECCPQLAEYMLPLYDPASRLQIPWTGQWNPTERTWTAFAGETLTYDSNIFASEHDVQDDWISNTTIGGSYRRAGSRYWALASAALTYSSYLDHDEENGLNFWSQVDAGFDGACFYGSVSNRLNYLDNPIVTRNDVVTVIDEDRSHYWQDTLIARGGYNGSCWKAELAYTLDWFSADGSGSLQSFDHVENGVEARADYSVSEKTTLGAYAGARWLAWDRGGLNDYTAYSTGATFSWRPTWKLGIVGRVGAGWLDSDGGSDDSTVVGSLEARWEASQNVSLELGWSRSYEASFEAGDQVMDIFRVRAQALIGGCFTLDGSAGLQVGDVHDTTLNSAHDYELWFINLMVHRQLGPHWGFDAGYQLRVQSASSDGIDFDEHRLTVGVSYSL